MRKFLNYYLPLFLSVALAVTAGLFYETTNIPVAFAAISSSPVQQKAGTVASCTSFTITLPSTPTSGNLLVVTAGENTTTCHITSITSTNTTWAGAADIYCNTLRGAEIWHGTPSASAGTVITINLGGGGSGNNRANVSEWSGTDGTLDTGTQLCSSGTATHSITATTTPTSGLNVLIIASRSGSGSETALAAPFTDLLNLASSTPSAYSVVASASGGYAADWTISTSAAYDTSIAVYKATGAAAATPDAIFFAGD